MKSDFLRNISRENWIWLDNVWLVNKDRFFSKVWNIMSNIQYDSTRSNFLKEVNFIILLQEPFFSYLS